MTLAERKIVMTNYFRKCVYCILIYYYYDKEKFSIWNCEMFMVDFEHAMWEAIEKMFPCVINLMLQ